MRQQYAIIGRRWFDKKNGNTYHSVHVYINCKKVGANDIEYGYGDQYKESGIAILRELGLTKAKNYYEFNSQVGKGNIIYFVSDVAKKKDL